MKILKFCFFVFLIFTQVSPQSRIFHYRGTYNALNSTYRHFSPLYGAILVETGVLENLYKFGNHTAWSGGEDLDLELDETSDATIKLIHELFMLNPGNNRIVHSLDQKKFSILFDPTIIAHLIYFIERTEFRLLVEAQGAENKAKICKKAANSFLKLTRLSTIITTKTKNKLQAIYDAREFAHMSRKTADFMKNRKRYHHLCKLLSLIAHSLHECREQYYPPFITFSILLAFLYQKYPPEECLEPYFQTLLYFDKSKPLHIPKSKKIPTYQSSILRINFSDFLKKNYTTTQLEDQLRKIHLPQYAETFVRYGLNNFEQIGCALIYKQHTKNALPPLINFKKIRYLNQEYSDCTETAVRNIINLLIYNSEDNTFNLANLPRRREDQPWNLHPALSTFYQNNESLDQAEDIDTHLQWAQVVSRHPTIKYAHHSNEPVEIDTTEENFVKLWNILFMNYQPGTEINPPRSIVEMCQQLGLVCLQEHQYDLFYQQLNAQPIRKRYRIHLANKGFILLDIEPEHMQVTIEKIRHPQILYTQALSKCLQNAHKRAQLAHLTSLFASSQPFDSLLALAKHRRVKTSSTLYALYAKPLHHPAACINALKRILSLPAPLELSHAHLAIRCTQYLTALSNVLGHPHYTTEVIKAVLLARNPDMHGYLRSIITLLVQHLGQRPVSSSVGSGSTEPDIYLQQPIIPEQGYNKLSLVKFIFNTYLFPVDEATGTVQALQTIPGPEVIMIFKGLYKALEQHDKARFLLSILPALTRVAQQRGVSITHLLDELRRGTHAIDLTPLFYMDQIVFDQPLTLIGLQLVLDMKLYALDDKYPQHLVQNLFENITKFTDFSTNMFFKFLKALFIDKQINDEVISKIDRQISIRVYPHFLVHLTKRMQSLTTEISGRLNQFITFLVIKSALKNLMHQEDHEALKNALLSAISTLDSTRNFRIIRFCMSKNYFEGTSMDILIHAFGRLDSTDQTNKVLITLLKKNSIETYNIIVALLETWLDSDAVLASSVVSIVQELLTEAIDNHESRTFNKFDTLIRILGKIIDTSDKSSKNHEIFEPIRSHLQQIENLPQRLAELFKRYDLI